MTTEELKAIAAQLRKPSGEFANKVGEMMNVGNEHLYNNSIAVLSPNAGDQILEIGMGNGKFTKDILKSGKELNYTGCDYSEDMVKAATEINYNLVDKGVARFIHSHAENLPFHNASFDHVFTLNTLYFYEDPFVTLKEYSRVLKKKGRLIIGIRPENEMISYPMTKFGFQLFNLNELKSILEAANFKVDRIFEKKEPDQELNGMKLKVTSLIAVGINNG